MKSRKRNPPSMTAVLDTTRMLNITVRYTTQAATRPRHIFGHMTSKTHNPWMKWTAIQSSEANMVYPAVSRPRFSPYRKVFCLSQHHRHLSQNTNLSIVSNIRQNHVLDLSPTADQSQWAVDNRRLRPYSTEGTVRGRREPITVRGQ